MNDRLLLAFYGDDFTGSTDALEALHQYGMRTILFLEPPNEEMLSRFQDIQCIGVAGTARAKNINGMEKELSPVFDSFKDLNPYCVHYKICSTFDSSPSIGSIGYAADLARDYFDKGVFPLLAAAPVLGRYTVFANHYAIFHNTIYRLDKHPVMSNHPITPMDESNLVKHLSDQTKQNIFNVSVLDQEEKEDTLLGKEQGIALFDALEDKHMNYFGKQLWNNKNEKSMFVIGSSGVEYALGDIWKNNEEIKKSKFNFTAKNIEKMLVISGSVSEVTKRQLEIAKDEGFYTEQIPYELLGHNDLPKSYLNKIIDLLEEKKKVILYTAKGADDENIFKTKNYFDNLNIKEKYGNYIGKQLGKWTKYILDNCTLERLVVSGGDTSGFITSQLGIYGMEVIESIAPGAPLCKSYSENERYNNLEIALKSGQLGGEKFYNNVFCIGEK